MDGGKTISETLETLTFLDDQNRTMTYKVTSAPNTPFEELVNKVNVNLIKADDKRCMVEFTGSFDALDDGARNNLGKSLLDAYEGILKGLKNLHEK
jgi:hypothetical protein